jgi:uncharacterized protein YjiK
MISCFLKKWIAKINCYYVPVMLTTLVGSSLLVIAPLFWFQPNSGTLADFVWSRSFKIPAIPKNLSGITYSPESETLFLVSNTPARIYEITPEGRLIRQIDLVGFHDTEDIVFVEKQTFAVVEERRKTVVVFEIAPTAKAVQYANCRHIQALPPEGVNKGLEGLAWDPVLRTFLISQENNPRAVYTIPYGAKGDAQEVPSLHELPWIKLGCYSGIFFDSVSRRLLILSRRSAKIKDYSLEGQEKGSLNLFRSIPGIIRTEGLTVVPGGDLYVCSEPNRVDIFTRTQRTTEMRLLPSGDRVDIADNESAQRYPDGVERQRN